MEQYDWKQSKFYLTYKFKKKFNHTSFLIISRVSFNRSMSLETPLGISKIVSCKAWVWLRIITFKSFKVVHRVLNSNSSRRSKIKQVLPLFWIKISVNWVVMSAGPSAPWCRPYRWSLCCTSYPEPDTLAPNRRGTCRARRRELALRGCQLLACTFSTGIWFRREHCGGLRSAKPTERDHKDVRSSLF